MTLRKLTVGAWVNFEGEDHQIVALAGGAVRLRSPIGHAQLVLATDLLCHGAELAAPERSPGGERSEDVLVRGNLDKDAFVQALPAEEAERVRLLEAHLREVLTGYPGGAPLGDEPPNPLYAPTVGITEKIKAKRAELEGTPLKCSERTLWRYYENYRNLGAFGLVDKAKIRIRDPLAGIDARIYQAILEQASIETEESTAHLARFSRRVRQRLEASYGSDAPALPADRTFRRLVWRVAASLHPSLPADQRRSRAAQKPGVHQHFYASRPGQIVMMDSTRLDTFAYDPLTDQTVPIEMTLAIDLFTRSIVAWRLTPLGANAVDAVMLLADMLTPEPMRPGWADHLLYAYYGIGVERTCTVDERLAAAAARPIIWPETLVIDNGKIYDSGTLLNGCVRYGINYQPTRFKKPTDKPEVEAVFRTINSGFTEHVAGQKGRNVAHRGRDVTKSARWTIDEIEEFFAEFVIAVYQRRPHTGLYAPGYPKAEMSPNDMYALGVAITGTIPAPGGYPYLELLPVEWRQTHPYGVQLDYLIYDGDGLDGCRDVTSTYPGGRWPIRKDPRNRLQVFFMNPKTGWHALKWQHAEHWVEPFTDRTIVYVRAELARRGHPDPDRAEFAAALDALQASMDAPETASAKDRRRLARDRARVRSTLRDQARATFRAAAVDAADALPDPSQVADEGPASQLGSLELRPFGVYGAGDPFVDNRAAKDEPR